MRFTDKNQFDRMREARRHGDALMPVMNYCIRREDRFHALDCHWHSEMELFRVMQGTLTVQCGTDLFEAHAGDIVFFNSGELHAAVPVEAGEELYFEAIVFSPDLLCSTANDIIRVKYIQPVLDGELTSKGMRTLTALIVFPDTSLKVVPLPIASIASLLYFKR